MIRLSPEQALKKIESNWPSSGTESIPLSQASQRILAEDIISDRAQPPFDRVTMDGYAFYFDETNNSREFQLESSAFAGEAAAELQNKNNCIEIATGAPIPVGCNCVVPYEQCSEEHNCIRLSEDFKANAYTNIHRMGSDCPANSSLLETGTRIYARHISVIASMGYATLSVRALPRITLCSTGDELVEVDANILPHQIRRSNSYTLESIIKQQHCGLCEVQHLEDRKESVSAFIEQQLKESDILIFCGAVSKGKKDFVAPCLEDAGFETLFHGIAQKPGKPMWFGKHPKGCIAFGLPGNPVSTHFCFQHYLLPFLIEAPRQSLILPLAADITNKSPLCSFPPAKINDEKSAEAIAFNTSGDYLSLAQSDGYLEIAPQQELKAGEPVRFTYWNG